MNRPDPAAAAIAFAVMLEDPFEAHEFLDHWYNGGFPEIRDRWPEAPEDIYIGADPLHPQTVLEDEALTLGAAGQMPPARIPEESWQPTFEAWAEERGLSLTRRSGHFINPSTSTARRAWQKALDFAYHYGQPQEPKP